MDIKDMKVEEIANLINNALQDNKGISVNKICDTLNIKRSTLKSRLTRCGYGFNSDKNRYELISENNSITGNTTNKTTNKPIKQTTKDNTIANTKKTTKEITGNKRGITKHITNKSQFETTEQITEHTIIKTTDENTKNKLTIEERITELELAVKRLENKSRKIKGITISNTKDTTVKSIRLYTEVKEELDKYIAAHQGIKVIDILSNAIMEYIKLH